eukprot:gene12152-8695_t
MSDSLDSELISLINRINKVQNVVGGKKKNGGFGDARGKIDHFIDLSERMKERLETIKAAVDEIKKLEKVPGANPTELITNQSKVRTELNLISEEWKELDTIHRLEKRKKRSRYTQEELDGRAMVVYTLQMSIQAIKDSQRSGFVKGIETKRMVTMEESELFKKRDIETGNPNNPNGTSAGTAAGAAGFNSTGPPRMGARNNQMTDQQRAQLMMIKDRDQEFDGQIDEIGKGLDILRELAQQANEEVKLQNTMLDVLEEKVNDVQERVLNINERMKDTLEKVRKSDKICMDIFCLIILIGMIIVLYKLSTDNQKKSS